MYFFIYHIKRKRNYKDYLYPNKEANSGENENTNSHSTRKPRTHTTWPSIYKDLEKKIVIECHAYWEWSIIDIRESLIRHTSYILYRDKRFLVYTYPNIVNFESRWQTLIRDVQHLYLSVIRRKAALIFWIVVKRAPNCLP